MRVPLIMRPPRGCEPRVVDAIVEHLDVPATIRDIANAPTLAASEGRTLLGHVRGDEPTNPRPISISENWGFASFETERYKLVVDEDAVRAGFVVLLETRRIVQPDFFRHVLNESRGLR